MNRIVRYPADLVCFPLPKKKVGNAYSKNLGKSLRMDIVSVREVPYGLYGRYALIALCELSRQSGKDRITEGFTLNSLLGSIVGTHPTGRQLNLFENQLLNWISTFVTLKRQENLQRQYKNLAIISDAVFLLEKNKEISNQKLFIKFSEDGFSFFSKTLIPIPKESLKTINRPIEFDLLCWLISTEYQLSARNQESVEINWQHLFRQFDADKTHQARFKKELISILETVRINSYPEASFSFSERGIQIHRTSLLTERKECFFVPSTLVEGVIAGGN